MAVTFLVARMVRSDIVAAVAGAPHVTNRPRLICAMQVLEAASIIGLSRRTQSLTGRVGRSSAWRCPRRCPLWAQRRRWARGQGEVVHAHVRAVSCPRNHRMWLLSIESVASLLWVMGLAVTRVVFVLGASFGERVIGGGLAWGVAISVVATLQLAVALALRLLGPLYTGAYRAISAAAALRCQAIALVRGPREQRVVWDIEREALDAEAVARPR